MSITARTQLLAMIHANWATQCISVAARLKIADHLRASPKSADELAAVVDANPKALYRLLRALAGLGIVHEAGNDAKAHFKLTTLGELLCADSPESLQSYAALASEKPYYQAWGELFYSIKTGEAGFEQLVGEDFHHYLATHPEFANIFNSGMLQKYQGVIPAIVAAYDFSHFNTVIDIGGGYGQLLHYILQQYPAVHGVLFDLPEAIQQAKPLFPKTLLTRCTLIAGDAFETIPPGGDVYVLKSFINNWEDADASRILQKLHHVAKPETKLCFIEPLILPANQADDIKLFDLLLLTLHKGHERSASDFKKLCDATGFSLERIIPTSAGFSIIEAKKKIT